MVKPGVWENRLSYTTLDENAVGAVLMQALEFTPDAVMRVKRPDGSCAYTSNAPNVADLVALVEGQLFSDEPAYPSCPLEGCDCQLDRPCPRIFG